MVLSVRVCLPVAVFTVNFGVGRYCLGIVTHPVAEGVNTPPVVVEPTPAPVIEIPPAQQITPTWIYAIIGIGAALAVVVIVLIVRTRRP